MGLHTIIGQKIDQSQKFLEDGTRIPVTTLWVKENVVVSHKTIDKDNYSAIQLGFGQKKKASKAQMGQIKGANLKAAPKFLKEVRVNEEDSLPNLGEIINAAEVFKPGDVINVTGISKGKGYAGVVKRHHFKGGPRTHGQSDRERAPGSIGQTTTPGRVYKGKRMAGRMGHERVTIKNLEIVDVSEDTILVRGLVPGGKNSLVMVKKVSENKKFVPLFKEKTEEIDSAGQQIHVAGDARKNASEDSRLPHVSGDAQQSEETQSSEPASLSESRSAEAGERQDAELKSAFSSPKSGQTTASLKNPYETGLSDSPKEQNEDKKEEVKNAGK